MDEILAKLYHSLDIAVFSKELDGFKLCTQAPDWLMSLVSEEELKSSCNLGELFPFLECYFPSFDYHWKSENIIALRSDVWVETIGLGYEIPLEANAIYMDGAAFILLQHLGEKHEEKVEILQKARDNLLAKEKLERRLAQTSKC